MTTTPIDDSEITLWILKNMGPVGRSQLDEHNYVKPSELAHAIGVTPNMIFSYLRDGRIKTAYDSKGHKVISREELFKYLRARLTKQAEKERKIKAELEQI